MNKLQIVLALYLFSISSLLHAKDSVTLSNGDLITGNVLEIKQDRTLLLSHPATDDLIEIDSTKTKKLLLNQTIAHSNKPQKALLRLVNGDAFFGRVLHMDTTDLHFESELAGVFKIPKKSIHDLKLGSAISQPIYQSTHTRKLFTKNTDWKLEGETFVSNRYAQMWQQFELPKNFSLQFTMEWDNSPSISFHLGANTSFISEKNNRYVVLLKRNSIVVTHPGTTTPKNRNKLTHRINNFNAKNKVDVTIQVSRLAGTIDIFINDKKVHSYKDLSGIPPKGNFIGIQNTSRNNELKISELKLSTWHQRISPKNLNKALKTNQEIIEFLNFNQHIGSLIAIEPTENEAQKCYFNSDNFLNKDVSIDFNQVTALYFPNKLKVHKKNQSELKNGNKITLSNVTLKEGTITADHAILGSIKLSKSAFLSLSLN